MSIVDDFAAIAKLMKGDHKPTPKPDWQYTGQHPECFGCLNSTHWKLDFAEHRAECQECGSEATLESRQEEYERLNP